MTIDKQALREEFLYMQDHYSDPADRERQDIYIAAEAALNELDVKEEQRANWFRVAQRLGEDLDTAERRMAELEAREVNLSKLSVGEVMHMSGFSRDYAEGWCAGNDNAIHEIRTAGIKVKGE
ncbi:ead/Ea22-like family protein [Salmonella enterica]|nr:ead/Ea22-like family protein [Salmonella enterica]EJT6305078.1 ead/Ea22-like family protein [Salmonella enterica]EKH3361628.1 ead/Ea22-like family protein [Salmonella enterica]